MSDEIHEWIALFAGIVATVYTLRVSLLFFKIKKEVCRLLAFQMLAEAYLSLATLIFAVAAFFGWLEQWPTWFLSCLRISMFLFAGVTTYRLYVFMKKDG